MNYSQLLEKAATLPKGKYKAYTERSNELVGPMLLTREYSWRTYSCAVKALKKAKRMAESLDYRTKGEADGVIYGIEEVTTP